GTFAVRRLAAAAGLVLLVTGVWRYIRTLSAHPAAPALALLSLLLVWGTTPFAWSGFLGLNSLALTMAYPSTFTLGLAFHFWAWLTGALREGGAGGWGAWTGLGVLWGVILLCHQLSGIVASLGAIATVVAARAGRVVWPRLGVAAAAGAVVLWAWPYYDFFALLGAGDGLESVHRVLYTRLLARYGLVLLGVAALIPRWLRDRRDPLAVFFALGGVVVSAGWVAGHCSGGGRRRGRSGTWCRAMCCRRRWLSGTGSRGRDTTGSRRGCGTGTWSWPRGGRRGRFRRTGRTRSRPVTLTSSFRTGSGGRRP